MIEKVYTEEIENIVNLLNDVITNVAAEYGSDVFYQHGHPLEIVNTLRERSADSTLKFKKFPLIALLEDFTAESRTGVFKATAKVDVLIITDTDKQYKATERYINSFDAILTPLYDLFMKHLKAQKNVHVQHRAIPHQKINHLYWGQKGLYNNTGNIFDDYIDAIEIKGLDLKIYR